MKVRPPLKTGGMFRSTAVLALLAVGLLSLAALADDEYDNADGSFDMEGGEDDESAEAALSNLNDEAGDDWGDAALAGAQDLATQRMAAKNQRLMASLARLRRDNTHMKEQVGRVSRAGLEAASFGHRITQQVQAMMRMSHSAAIPEPQVETGRHIRLGEAQRVQVRSHEKQKVSSGSSESSEFNVTAELNELGVRPSKNTLGADLLNDAISIKDGIKTYPTAGAFCEGMIQEGTITTKDCNLGSKMLCDGQWQYCKLVKESNGLDEPITIESRTFSCATKGILECEEHREKYASEGWLKEKKENDAELMKKSMHLAWQQAKYQAQQREIATANAKAKSKSALDAAMGQGERQVDVARLQGNAPLPEPVRDKKMNQLKTKMREMKYELQDKGKIFKALRHVAPKCSDAYDTCSAACDKNEPDMTLGAQAIMGTVTPCQMKCKNTVVDCVMSFVATTYKDITVEAMAAATKP